MKSLKYSDQGMLLELSIEMEQERAFKPKSVQLSLNHKLEGDEQAQNPFPYFSDAITVLGLWSLWSQCNPVEPELARYLSNGLKNLDTHFPLFARSSERILPLTKKLEKDRSELAVGLSQSYFDILGSAWRDEKLCLHTLSSLCESISYLEDQLDAPLLYNYTTLLDKQSHHHWLSLLSFLYNLRALVATDFNTHCFESAFDGVKLDPVSDYIPKPEYVIHDSLLIADMEDHWLKAGKSATNASEKKRLEQLYEKMDSSLRKYAHNSYCLYHSLPSDMFHKSEGQNREENLFQVQLDWLFGSDAGLLYRIREELFGIQEGYHRIFWLDAPMMRPKHAQTLEVCCLLKPDYYQKLGTVAA